MSRVIDWVRGFWRAEGESADGSSGTRRQASAAEVLEQIPEETAELSAADAGAAIDRLLLAGASGVGVEQSKLLYAKALRMLSEREPSVRSDIDKAITTEATKKLLERGDEPAIATLLDLMELIPYFWIRSHEPGPMAVKTIVEFMRTPSARRNSAVNLARELKFEAAPAVLIECLRDDDAEIREGAASALGFFTRDYRYSYPSHDICDALAKALERDPEFWEAARALGKHGSPRAAPGLVRLMKHYKSRFEAGETPGYWYYVAGAAEMIGKILKSNRSDKSSVEAGRMLVEVYDGPWQSVQASEYHLHEIIEKDFQEAFESFGWTPCLAGMNYWAWRDEYMRKEEKEKRDRSITAEQEFARALMPLATRARETLTRLLQAETEQFTHDRITECLGHLGDQRVAADLLEIFKRDEHSPDRIVKALVAVGGPVSDQFIVKAFEDRVEFLPLVCQALPRFQIQDLRPLLDQALQDPSENVRAAALLSFVDQPNTQVADHFLKALDDPSSDVRDAAAACLRAVATSDLTMQVIQLFPSLKNGKPVCAKWLADLKDPRAVDALAAETQNQDPEVAHLCAEALGVIQDPRAADALAGTRDQDGHIVIWCARALAAIQDPRAIPALQHAFLTAVDSWRKSQIRELIGILTPYDQPAVYEFLREQYKERPEYQDLLVEAFAKFPPAEIPVYPDCFEFRGSNGATCWSEKDAFWASALKRRGDEKAKRALDDALLFVVSRLEGATMVYLMDHISERDQHTWGLKFAASERAFLSWTDQSIYFGAKDLFEWLAGEHWSSQAMGEYRKRFGKQDLRAMPDLRAMAEAESHSVPRPTNNE